MPRASHPHRARYKTHLPLSPCPKTKPKQTRLGTRTSALAGKQISQEGAVSRRLLPYTTPKVSHGAGTGAGTAATIVKAPPATRSPSRGARLRGEERRRPALPRRGHPAARHRKVPAAPTRRSLTSSPVHHLLRAPPGHRLHGELNPAGAGTSPRCRMQPRSSGRRLVPSHAAVPAAPLRAAPSPAWLLPPAAAGPAPVLPRLQVLSRAGPSVDVTDGSGAAAGG